LAEDASREFLAGCRYKGHAANDQRYSDRIVSAIAPNTPARRAGVQSAQMLTGM
jgi:hypothetical protein